MQSRISIKADFFNKKTAYWQVNAVPSEDPKDDMVKDFIYKLQGVSRWALIEFPAPSDLTGKMYYNIFPIPPQELREQISDMQEAVEKFECYSQPDGSDMPQKVNTKSVVIRDNSINFQSFLKSQGIEYTAHGNGTQFFIADNETLFYLGMKLAEYKAANP